eukprot:SAG22_NODE_1085_length_5632_cov_40.777697_7_plen_103_part_00
MLPSTDFLSKTVPFHVVPLSQEDNYLNSISYLVSSRKALSVFPRASTRTASKTVPFRAVCLSLARRRPEDLVRCAAVVSRSVREPFQGQVRRPAPGEPGPGE